MCTTVPLELKVWYTLADVVHTNKTKRQECPKSSAGKFIFNKLLLPIHLHRVSPGVRTHLSLPVTGLVACGEVPRSWSGAFQPCRAG